MSIAREDLQKIRAYTKEEIIEAIGTSWYFDNITVQILRALEENKMNKIRAEHKEALKKATAARTKFSEWIKDMCIKYGDGDAVKFTRVPLEELKHGAELEKAMNIAEKEERKLGREFDKLLGVRR